MFRLCSLRSVRSPDPHLDKAVLYLVTSLCRQRLPFGFLARHLIELLQQLRHEVYSLDSGMVQHSADNYDGSNQKKESGSGEKGDFFILLLPDFPRSYGG